MHVRQLRCSRSSQIATKKTESLSFIDVVLVVYPSRPRSSPVHPHHHPAGTYPPASRTLSAARRAPTRSQTVVAVQPQAAPASNEAALYTTCRCGPSCQTGARIAGGLTGCTGGDGCAGEKGWRSDSPLSDSWAESCRLCPRVDGDGSFHHSRVWLCWRRCRRCWSGRWGRPGRGCCTGCCCSTDLAGAGRGSSAE